MTRCDPIASKIKLQVEIKSEKTSGWMRSERDSLTLLSYITLQPMDRRPEVSVKEVVRSSASVDLNASLDPVNVVMTANQESEEDKSR